jgi:hypothetical protein
MVLFNYKLIKAKETPKVTEKKPLFSKPDAALLWLESSVLVVWLVKGLCLTGVAFTLRMWLKPRRVNCLGYIFMIMMATGVF